MLLLFLGVIALILLIAISILISLSEISFAAARDVRLRARADAGDERATAFLALRRNSGQVMTVLQILLNAVGILGGMISSEMLAPPIANILTGWGLDSASAQSIASATGFVFTTGIFVLFADLLPKRIAMNAPDRIALSVGWFPAAALRVLYPLVWVFSKISDALLRALKIPAASAVDAEISQKGCTSG